MGHFIWPLILVGVLLPGCRGQRISEENDRLRREVMTLTQQVRALEHRAEAAEKRLEIEVQRADREPVPLPPGVTAPHVSRIEILTPSRGIDTARDGMDDAVRLRLGTYDQHNRFLQTVATVDVTLVATPPGQEAVTLATAHFEAPAFNEAYRTTALGGTHYTLVIPLQQPPPQGVTRLTASVRLTDLLTGAMHEAERIVNIAR